MVEGGVNRFLKSYRKIIIDDIDGR